MKRGYNQSDFIARGIGEVFSVPVKINLLQRIRKTATQTKKSRFERYENVNRIFEIKDGKGFSGKHLLLVDDVITTGSTLISCAEVLLTIPGSKVSIAAAAYAHH
jgi:predicted amidophosphoribosyltransferase